MTDRAWLLLVIAIILVVFSPAFSSEICFVDDAQMVAGLKQVNQWSLHDIFFPGASEGLYYRPLIPLFFLADRTFFGLSPFSLHSENVLLHLANTLLVFFLVRQIVNQKASQASSKVAFIGSLLFGLHPLVTESVNWISGRTDLLLGFFLLLSTLLLTRYLATGKKQLAWLATISFLGALLSKELAIAFLPGFFLILYAKKQNSNAHDYATSFLPKKLIVIGGVTLLVSGAFLLLRATAFVSNSTRIGRTLQYLQINPSHSFFLFLGATGFYLKKLFLPWPLNFAIVEIDPLYELAAIPLLGLALYIAWRGTIFTAIFTTGLLLFTPALLIALNQIAWTPYAERYLYTTTAFISIAIVAYCCSRQSYLVAKPWSNAFLAIFMIGWTATTLQRNLTWQTNRRLLQDTAQKSPFSRTIQSAYGEALLEDSEYEQAMIYSKRAIKLPSQPLSYDQAPEHSIALIQYRRGNMTEAISSFETIIKNTSGKSPEAHEGLIDCHRSLWAQATGQIEKREHFRAMLLHGEQLFALRPDPLIYYNLGKIALTINEQDEAKRLFTLAVSQMTPGHEFLPFAQKLLQHAEAM